MPPDASKLDVSVILLTYNGGDFVRQKAIALLDEISEFKNCELIIIDDCSSDACVDFVNSNDNPKLKLIRKCERKGIPDQ
jgi:glycosyltransferase involved in cell wall biosynthesis